MQVISKHKWPKITPKPPTAKNIPRFTTVRLLPRNRTYCTKKFVLESMEVGERRGEAWKNLPP